MSQVILTPIGWKLLPDTVSWPEKPQCICETQGFDACEKAIDDYHNAVREASRHLVDIAEEDWERVSDLALVSSLKDGFVKLIQDDTPYTIDAEFEVKEQFQYVYPFSDKWHDAPCTYNGGQQIKYRQIARLVN